MEDPLQFFPRLHTWLHTRWIGSTYPFRKFGHGVSVTHSCDILRSIAHEIAIDDKVYLAPDVWLNVVPGPSGPEPKITIGPRCGIGRRSMISAKNQIVLEDFVLFAPGVLVMDHNHEFADISQPISAQGVTEGGKIRIEKNCWLGFGAVVLCGSGELVVGRNSIIGANSVVTRSVPPYSIMAGNPAKLVKRYDAQSQKWVKASESALS
ncbi:MAG TPA: acyltransferase [Verrucomicrobiae bacterium]|nr:acyltransferase [Verrucomicrobiae bacterium]